MKIISKILCYLIFVILYSSCTSSKFIFKKFDEKENINSNNWVTYKQPKNGKDFLASLNDIQIVKKSTTIDSIEIIPEAKIRNKEIIIKADTSKKINTNSKEKNYSQIKKIEPRSLLSFVSSILGFILTALSFIEFSFRDLGSITIIGLLGLGLVGFISAIILGIYGGEKIKENPKKYKGKQFANIGKKLGWIGVYLATTALFILTLILLFVIILFLLL